MGASKRYVTKQTILSNLDDIDSIFSADCLVFDNWSFKFFEDLNLKDREFRESYELDFIKSISSSISKDDIKNLSSLSETLISLHNNPKWIDIEFVAVRLGINFEKEDSGQLFKLARLASDKIIEFFDKPNREDKIKIILSD
jgi:hypothetical protein